MPGRALVTGAAGFVGRHLIRRLLAEGTSVVALCRRPDDLADLADPALVVAVGDVRDDASLARQLAGVETLFHLAAVRNRPGSAVADMRAVNEAATPRLARRALEAGVGRFVHLSTAQVFGPSSTPLDEDAPLVSAASAGAYVLSKARAVPELRRLVAEGFPITILYPTIVYGPDHPSRPNRVTSHIRRLLRFGFDFAIGGGEAPRDLVHVDDLVTAIVAAGTRREAAGRELLIPGEGVTQRGLGEQVALAAGRRAPLLVSIPVRPARTAAKLLDRALGHDPGAGLAFAIDTLRREWTFSGERATALLDHRPRPLARGIAETAAWILRQRLGAEHR